MKFYNIKFDFEPKITGRRNGSFAVEIRKTHLKKMNIKNISTAFLIATVTI